MKLIGEGGNWKVFEDPDVEEQVIKIPKTDVFSTSCQKNIENYNAIKGIFFSVKYLKKLRLNGSDVLVTENINASTNRVYVSPNSYTTDTQRLVRQLNPFSKIDISESIEEQHLGQTKVIEIVNIDVFLAGIKETLRRATAHGIGIEFDAYFFGVERYAKSTTLDYKIADFDNIFTNSKVSFEENADEFIRAFYLFLDYFVEEQHKASYIETIKSSFNNNL